MSTPAPNPSQNDLPLSPLWPAWRLRNGAKMASRGELDLCVESLENWAFVSAGVLIAGLVGELIEPAAQPLVAPWLPISWWTICNTLVLVGVSGEVIFGRMGSNRQKEITRRADLELERVKKGFGQRRLEMDPFIAALKGKTVAPVEVVYQVEDSAECLILAMDIWSGLNRAGWKVESPIPFVRDRAGKYQHVAAAISVGGFPTDVTVVVRARDEWDRAGIAFETVVAALKIGLPLFPLGAGEFPDLPEGTLRVVVAPRA